ncbi:acetyl-CoA acetyltransferase [Rhodococcus sp. ARC_M6]|uniref:acetyl-CoA acetyltransferase n=1 Tax=Rhodococcus sp. ARC_M6 TaxID=2928852 RepID=UPI001FB3BF8E|nr:acetyl-CoA acetyltransferase [Rhodococcus sp. ARC_M6]MCJ0904051.1 acetyl-CoA acetyltransferase [Rhodococcus sp. ARC_M6]
MVDTSRIPVIVGVGDLRWNPVDGHREPLDLIHEATVAALSDSGQPSLGEHVDSVYAIKTVSWSYDDLPGLLAARVGATPRSTATSPIGGHWPAALLDRIGAAIAAGESSVALLAGGESHASTTVLRKSGVTPDSIGWTAAPGGPPGFDPTDLGSPEMQRAGFIVPTRVYPLFENSFSATIGHDAAQSLTWSARMYAAFSELAAKNPASWTPDVRTVEEISTIGPGNRMVSEPYPLMLNAMPFVNQAAAVVVCSLEKAREFGVDEDKLVYLWGGAGATDPLDILSRNNFHASAAMHDAVDRTLDSAGVGADALDIVDAYSCFPIVPKLLIRELGLPDNTIPSVTGGHSFFGGPLNSYTLHSIAEVTRRLRADGELALVHGNGGFLTHQHAVLLSASAHADGYIGDPEARSLSADAPELVTGYSGNAEIITATVEYGRGGEPETGFVIATTPDGGRVAGHTGAENAAELTQFSGNNPAAIGRTVHIVDENGKLTLMF